MSINGPGKIPMKITKKNNGTNTENSKTVTSFEIPILCGKPKAILLYNKTV